MKPAGGLLLTLAALAVAAPAAAGPWVMPKGDGQVILKYEDMRATEGFDPNGVSMPMPAERRETFISVFAEYGLTARLGVQFKGDWQSGRDAFVDYEGTGPLEIGVNWQVWRNTNTAVALYGGVAQAGAGRNAGYATPGAGNQDFEVRAAFGRSYGKLKWLNYTADSGFVTLEVARRMRSGLPHETRVDATLGAHFGQDWMTLTQVYAGQADNDGPRWVQMESSVVRRMGNWSAQLGWRTTLSGREAPDVSGLVVGLWRRF
ncbi:outer membrane beta-barrel protein [Brevundimonas sp. M20]|uniref:outer membrane beta-barrel protein n=1 Tax=Brevundimonas sp. M20 TaxID=2591463 RepID=UPI001F0DD331|nr:outer membrane beta-barrel protein [Brevundimonas sp. M20]